MRNTLREFLKLSRQSPRSRACTDFGSLLAYTRWRSLSRQSPRSRASADFGSLLAYIKNQACPRTPFIWNILPSVCCFVTNISPYFLLFLFFITRGFSFLSKKTNLLSLSPSAILFLSIFVIIFFIHRKAYNL